MPTGNLTDPIFVWNFRDRPVLAVAGPVIANALVIPVYLPFVVGDASYYTFPFTDASFSGSYVSMYLFSLVTIAAGEAVVMYAIGLPLAHVLKSCGVAELFSADS